MTDTAPPRRLRPFLALALCAAAAAPRAQAPQLELGKMWLFENPPLGYLKDEYGFAPTPEWFEALRLASLRFGDWCSASFVSPKGLIMTNHHCVRDNIAAVAPPDQDWVENGFYAKSLEDEVRLQGLTVQQLVSMRNVTAEMLAGIEPSDDDAAAEKKRAANEERILEQASQQNEGLMPQVVTLHQGAAFHLYLYKVWDDIRLVCAPHLQTAHFGGDPDNFTFPRYCIDFAFCRAYENDAPADTSKHYFRWSRAGARSGDLVFVTGNPGSTGRLLTYAQMEFSRDAEYPMQLAMIENQLGILRKFAERSAEIARGIRGAILGHENSLKALTGYQSGLLDDRLMARKRELEAEFRQRVAADPALQERYGDVWEQLAEISARRTELEPKQFFQVPSYSGALGRAVAIVRAVDPAASEQERAVARSQALGGPMRRSPLFDALFVDHLERARDWLPPDDPYLQAVLAGGDPSAAVERFAGSVVGDREALSALLEGGQEAVAASPDPAIAAARALMPLLAANHELAQELGAREAVQNRRIGQALFAVYGDQISPDATMTLRFSDGRVDGYPYNGTIAPFRTSFYGLYGRNVEFENEPPFDLPQIWLDRKSSVEMQKAVDFVSTNDIIGGNSGSPVVDKELQVVGLIFDGNVEQLPNRFLFTEGSARSVSVHVDAIIEAMTKIYEATRVVEELTGG